MSVTKDEQDCLAVSVEELQAAQVVWDYMDMEHKLKKCDVIIALGSNDLRTGEVAADLYMRGLGDWLVLTGRSGKLTEGKWSKTEAEMFCDIALKKGVPKEKIILETEARNSGENALYTYKLLKSRNICPKSILLVQKPYMERRAYATFMKQWPNEVDVVVTSNKMALIDYPNSEVGDLRYIISIMVGDLQRIPLYAKCGFQIPQYIPAEVQDASELLMKSGKFSCHLVNKERTAL